MFTFFGSLELCAHPCVCVQVWQSWQRVVFLNQGTVLISQGILRRQHFCPYQFIQAPFVVTVLRAARLQERVGDGDELETFKPPNLSLWKLQLIWIQWICDTQLMAGPWRLILLWKSSFSLPFLVSIYNVSKFWFSFVTSFDLGKDQVFLPRNEMIYRRNVLSPSARFVAGVYCVLLSLTCQLHCIQIWLTVRRRHMASFPGLSCVYRLQGEQLA